MGGASKILMLLSTPFPFLYPRPSSAALRLARHSRTAALSSLSASHPFSNSTPTLLHPKSPFKSQLHSQSAAQREPYADSLLPSSAPISRGSALPGGLWPEWARLAENLAAGGYSGRGGDDDDEFVVLERMPEEFARAAEACLAFARDRPDALRLLGKKNIEVIVNSGSPSLFKNGANSARRMRLFLSGDESNVYLESDMAQTVDVMRYLLSYAYDSLDISEGIKNRYTELVEASVRSLLSEFVNMSGAAQDSKFTESTPRQAPISYEQSSRPPGQNVEMKRGDWVCPKCSFMNFARNSRCLECEEARPKRQLTGGEWECPQCDFFNYGKNMSCLRCDCKRPAEISSTTPYGKVSSVDQILSRGNNDKSDLEQKLAANDEKAERWFSKVSQLGDKADVSSAIADEDFPEIMPLRKGVNRFVVSTRKTPLERRLANSQSGVASGIGSNTPSESSINKSLDRILGRTSPAAGEADTGARGRFNSADYRQSITKSDPGYVPFVPLPPDMFSKPHNLNNEVLQKDDPTSMKGAAPSDSPSRSSTNSTESRNYNEPSGSSTNSTESRNYNEPSDSTERWSKKVAESDNVTDLASAIPDEDFPEIMPMRKGENRFVVSKKKDRSLTSPQYKRRLAMEQANKSDFVPFVPFPPGYFAKKDKQPEAAPASAPNNEAVAEERVQDVPEKLENRMGAPNWGSTGGSSQQPASTTNSQSYDTKFSGNNWNESRVDYTKENRNSGISPMSSTSDSRTYGQSHNKQFSGNNWNESRVDNTKESWDSRTSQVSNTSNNAIANRGSTQEPEKLQATSQNWKSFSGKSLEGSAVTEPDPLDMSEEAKTARWFRRAAQIKNISELSEIPDEDFPEIMPMRKGVNRFVVSKRKTPLERRLTSPQYRRNLPIVSSEPEKDAN